jgi:hypothetical protein
MRRKGIDVAVMAEDNSTIESGAKNLADGDAGTTLEGSDLAAFESSFLPALPQSLHFSSSEHS